MPFGRVHQLGEDAAQMNQLGIGAGLDDPAVVEDEDAIGVAQGGQSVGDEDDGAIGAGGVDGLLDQPFAGVVQCRGALVEDQDRWILEEDPGQGNPLPLSARQVLAALGDPRRYPPGIIRISS